MSRVSPTLLTLLMILAMTAWGGSWISGKIVANEASPEVLVFWRFAVSVIAFLPILFSYRKSLRLNRHSLFLTLLGALLIVSYNKMFFRGLQTGLAGAGGVLVTTLNPLLTALLATFFFRRRLGIREIIGFLLGLCGGLIILQVWTISWANLISSGNGYLIIASASWALLTIASEKAKTHISTLLFSFYTYAFALLFGFLFLPTEAIFAAFSYGANFWWNVVYLAVGATTFATTVYFFASTRLGAQRAASFIFLVPASAVLLSWAILGEVPKLTTILGGVIAIGAVYLINSKTNATR